jgi:hypothetical protein
MPTGTNHDEDFPASSHGNLLMKDPWPFPLMRKTRWVNGAVVVYHDARVRRSESSELREPENQCATNGSCNHPGFPNFKRLWKV